MAIASRHRPPYATRITYPNHDDVVWSSAGLARREAVSQWQEWAADTIAPIDVTVFDADRFAARWASRLVGEVRMLHLQAPAQRVVHTGRDGSAGSAAPSIQLVYARRGALNSRMDGKHFVVEPGQFVLLDNTRFYEMEMEAPHEALDLMMPQAWLERHLPDPGALLSRPMSVRRGWGAPLGSLLETMMAGLDDAPLSRSLIGEQIGSLLALAAGLHEPADLNRHRRYLTGRILRRIESDHADSELSAQAVAEDCGISKRHLQALLAHVGTGFVRELNATRLERAKDLLAHPHAAGVSITEVASRVGYLDSGYFTRLFRKRFGVTPREYRIRSHRR